MFKKAIIKNYDEKGFIVFRVAQFRSDSGKGTVHSAGLRQ